MDKPHPRTKAGIAYSRGNAAALQGKPKDRNPYLYWNKPGLAGWFDKGYDDAKVNNT